MGYYFCAAKKRLLEKVVLNIKQETSAASGCGVKERALELVDGTTGYGWMHQKVFCSF